jgi:hypothetical protein
MQACAAQARLTCRRFRAGGTPLVRLVTESKRQSLMHLVGGCFDWNLLLQGGKESAAQVQGREFNNIGKHNSEQTTADDVDQMKHEEGRLEVKNRAQKYGSRKCTCER